MAHQTTLKSVTVLALGLLLCTACSSPSVTPSIELTPVFTELTPIQPLALLEGPPGRRYLVEQGGRILTFTGATDTSVFVDISDRVDSGPSEAGLLGMAFHPQFAQNGQVFLSYTRPGNPLISVVARYTSPDGGLTLDAATEQVLLTLDQPFGNHNGGQIAFGPDGFLYIGFGDGGSAGDPLGNAQNTQTLFGSLLRIDVSSEPYAIPPDNPFAGGGGRPEIYAFGLRNPWRWSFDRDTGRLWLGDVGQNIWEEIDIIVNGGNYGWPIREGSGCFQASTCQEEGLIAPVAEYDHELGCSVTGGYVYRGSAVPALRGMYIYGDFCSGRIWGLNADVDGAVPIQLSNSGLNISSFAEDSAGELYVIDYAGGVFKITP